MKTRTVSRIVMATAFLFAGAQGALADSSSSSSIAGGNMPQSDKIPQDQRTDLTEGNKAVPDEYSTTPVRQGALIEVTDSKWLNKTVTGKGGEKIGKITKVLKDKKTDDIEYAFIEMPDAKHATPMRWNRLQEKGDKLTINATKDDLMPSIDRLDTKDISPDLAMFMEEIEQKRDEPKPKVGPGDGRGTNRPEPSAGDSGEDRAAGNLGPRAAPPTGAPQFKGEGEQKNQ
jgi:hypothetical protein